MRSPLLHCVQHAHRSRHPGDFPTQCPHPGCRSGRSKEEKDSGTVELNGYQWRRLRWLAADEKEGAFTWVREDASPLLWVPWLTQKIHSGSSQSHRIRVPEADTTLFHYTSLENLVSIIQSHDLYASHQRHMNDSSELARIMHEG